MASFRLSLVASVELASALRMPEFSWETLPVAFHSAKSDGMYSDEELRILAKYATVTVEKYQDLKLLLAPGETWTTCQRGELGENVSLCGCCEEDKIVDVARRVKAVNPKSQVYAYMHSLLAHPWYGAAHKLAERPDLWLRNLTNGTWIQNWPWFSFDHSNAASSAIWQQAVLNMSHYGDVDGVFVDGCIHPPHIEKHAAAANQAAKERMMAQLQGTLGAPVICGSNGVFIDGAIATQQQAWGASGNWAKHEIPLLQKAVAAGKMFQAHVHGSCPENATDPNTVNNLAAFLVAMGPYSYFMCGGWSDTKVAWYPIYDFPLGEPLGNATFIEGVYSRKFKSGTVATFDTKTETGNIIWGSKPAPGVCPATHPWAYRPRNDFDHCCATGDDKHGNVGINSLADRSLRGNSCKDDDYVKCTSKPCNDHSSVQVAI